MKSVKVFTLIAALMVIVVLAGCATTDTTAPASAQSNASKFIPPSAWKPADSDSPGTTKSNFTGREVIAGQEKDVLTMEVTFIKQDNDPFLMDGGTTRWGSFEIKDESILSQVRTASGVRFKAMGDGKRWKLVFHTKETMDDFCSYEAEIKTVNNRVVDIKIPYSSLKQPTWGKKAPFVKNNIMNISLQRHTNTISEIGPSTLKVFDFEFY